MNTVCISTKMSTTETVGDKTQGAPSTSKSRGNVPLSTHGSTPIKTGSLIPISLVKLVFNFSHYKVNVQNSLHQFYQGGCRPTQLTKAAMEESTGLGLLF